MLDNAPIGCFYSLFGLKRGKSHAAPTKVVANEDALPDYEDCVVSSSFIPAEKQTEAERIVAEAIEAASPSLRKLSKQIHEHPEIRWTEVYAHDHLTDYMEKAGFKVTRHAYGMKTAFIAECECGEGGPSIGFCSEYDALPGVGHGCGHNLIAISGVASAIGLRAALEQLNLSGKITLFGTPAEEANGGKIDLINKGAFDKMDVCMMLHPANADGIYIKMLALDQVYVEYYGRPAHAAASPWEGINALDAMVQAYSGLAMLRQQTPTTHRVHGIIVDGGKASNVIPDYTRGEFTVRAPTRAELEIFKAKVVNVFEAAAQATQCKVKLTWGRPYYDVIQNNPLCQHFEKYMVREGVKYLPRYEQESAAHGSTDMGNVSYIKPSAHPCFDIGTTVPLHTKEFAQAAITPEAHQRCLRASRSMALTMMDVVSDPKLLAAVKEDFEKATKAF
ncbi:hypothetical protein BZG36_05009 [Bifiguratus adelaidae]|uniref:Peptidase M20 domain-containing protein 2 n=1 Tax=Bifiguratus adelaidae TaxID=1938954 RepID=A0A261XU75_9FUNG|nr:hypothetical protein BZG36_05009 [Bifiguratus adelaidae]